MLHLFLTKEGVRALILVSRSFVYALRQSNRDFILLICNLRRAILELCICKYFVSKCIVLKFGIASEDFNFENWVLFWNLGSLVNISIPKIELRNRYLWKKNTRFGINFMLSILYIVSVHLVLYDWIIFCVGYISVKFEQPKE